MEEEPLHLQPFAALLGDLLASAGASAKRRLFAQKVDSNPGLSARGVHTL